MAIIFTLLALKSIMLLLVFHAYVTHGRTLNSIIESRDECPIPCSCYNSTVVCNAMHLTEVPINIPTRTRALHLNANAIENLDFSLLSKLTELEELHLRGNKLRGIGEKDIQFLPRLQHVDLRDNPLVCDCPLAFVVGRTFDDASPVEVILGDTKCVTPMQDGTGRASDVLRRLDCSHRSRRGEGRCHQQFCLNGGTCVDGKHGPFCECTDSYVGEHCERTNSDAVTIYIDDITYNSAKVSWRPSHHVTIDRYFVSLRELSPWSEPKYFWTHENYYIFVRLSSGALFQVCVTGYITDEDSLDECCKEFTTQPHPSRPEPEHPKSPRPHQPTTKSRDKESVIHKAAVILGSIIGVCAFFIICLTLIYKFRTLSNPRNWGRRSSSPPIDAETEPETEVSQDQGNENNTGQDLYVLSVPAAAHQTTPPEDERVAAGLDTDPALLDPIPMNRVLHALRTPSSCGLHEVASPNTVVLYRPENRSTEDCSALSRDNPSGTTPFFIVADGNHYPLDPALSHVLCSAMSRTNVLRDPPPNEPPPPYSERAEDVHLTLTSFEGGMEAESQPIDQCERDVDETGENM